MKDFKNYNPADGNGGKRDIDGTLEYAKTISKAMNGKSQGQLLHTIIAEAEKGKREGKLTNADLDNFYANISPMLDGAKRKKLKEIVEKLKAI